MTHPSDDKLLEFALDITASETERTEIEAHIAACSTCRARLDELRQDIDVIGGIRPRVSGLTLPIRRSGHRVVHSILRAAALVIFGIAVGFGASLSVRQEPVCVSQAYVALSAPADSINSCAVSDATEIPAHSYDDVLHGLE
jgi:hypothetical protein